MPLRREFVLNQKGHHRRRDPLIICRSGMTGSKGIKQYADRGLAPHPRNRTLQEMSLHGRKGVKGVVILQSLTLRGVGVHSYLCY